MTLGSVEVIILAMPFMIPLLILTTCELASFVHNSGWLDLVRGHLNVEGSITDFEQMWIESECLTF